MAKTITWIERCGYCRRVLATLYDDGSFDLAPKAGMTVVARIPRGVPSARGTPEPQTGVCLRWQCRLRRLFESVL